MTKPPPLALILTSVSTPEQAADSKQSLETQERDLRAIAEQRGWKVLDVLRVPGFSRSYYSWDECAQDMLKHGITALADLKRYTDSKAFDVFMVRDADRFGRTQALITQIAEIICIRQGLKIFSQINNTLFEGEAVRIWAAMAGLSSAGEMDKKRIYYHHGMERRAERGFHETRTPWYHRTVHDPDTGKAQRVELREDYRYIWDAVFDLVVKQRVGFHVIEDLLLEKYHIVNPVTGRKFHSRAIYMILCQDSGFWGHRVRGIRQHKLKTGHYPKVGEWVYNPEVPPPDGITMHPNVLPAVYTGQQAADMMDELRRRAEITGSRRPNNTSTFSGLVICDYCQHHMVHLSKPSGWRAYRCSKDARHIGDGSRFCETNPKSINYLKLVEWMKPFLAGLLTGQPLERAFPLYSAASENEIAALEKQIEKTKQESTTLIERLIHIPDSMLPQYQTKMQQLSDRAALLDEQYLKLKSQQQAASRDGQVAALHEIDTLGLDAFWELEQSHQQQILKRLFGNWRIIVADGEVIGVGIAGLRRGNSRKS